jgi:hypothetical protein
VSKTIDDAHALIESRLAEIDAEAGQLHRALASLGEGSRQNRRPTRRSTKRSAASPKPRRRSAPKRKSGNRAARGQRRQELLVTIGEKPGARPSELAAIIGINSTQVHALIAKARAEKLIVKSGKGYALRK